MTKKIKIYTDPKGLRYFRFNRLKWYIDEKARKRFKLTEQQYARRLIRTEVKKMQEAKSLRTKPSERKSVAVAYKSQQPPTRVNLDTLRSHTAPVAVPVRAMPQVSDPAIQEFIKRTAAKESKYQPGSIHSLEKDRNSFSEKEDKPSDLDEKDKKEPLLLKQAEKRQIKLSSGDEDVYMSVDKNDIPRFTSVMKKGSRAAIRHGRLSQVSQNAEEEAKGNWTKSIKIKDKNNRSITAPTSSIIKMAAAQGIDVKGISTKAELSNLLDKPENKHTELAKLKQAFISSAIDKAVKSVGVPSLSDEEDEDEEDFSDNFSDNFSDSEKFPKESGDNELLSPNQVALMKLSDENKDDKKIKGGSTNPVPVSGLSNHQIDKLMEHEKSYLGTVPRDHIIKLKEQIIPWNKASFIANLDPHDKPGYHWVACVLLPKKARVLYFDSFGEPCPEDMRKQIKKLVKRSMPCRGHDHDYEIPIFKENLIQVQDADTMNCGPFAMMFIKDTLAGVPFIKATPYDLSAQGERKVRKYIASLPRFSEL